jgi:hypothetical protein
LASGYVDHDVHVWDLERSELRFRLVGHWGDLTAGAFSPTGDRLATAGAEGALRVWSLVTGRQTHELSTDDRVVRAVRFDSEETLRLVTDDGAYVVWRLDEPPIGSTQDADVRCATLDEAGGWMCRDGRLHRVHELRDDDGPHSLQIGPALDAPTADRLVGDLQGVVYGTSVTMGVAESGRGKVWEQQKATLAFCVHERVVWAANAWDVRVYARADGRELQKDTTRGRIDDLVSVDGSVWARIDGGAELRAISATDGPHFQARPSTRTHAGREGAPVLRYTLRHALGSAAFSISAPDVRPPEPIEFTAPADVPVPEEPKSALHRGEEARAWLDRVARRLRHGRDRGYREQNEILEMHGSGTELSLVRGEVEVRLRLAHDGRRWRVGLVGTRGGGGVPIPASTMVRLARWLRRRDARSEDDALLRSARETEGARDVRFARAGGSISLSVTLAKLPSPTVLADWMLTALTCAS